MDDKRSDPEALGAIEGAIEGADAAGLGLTGVPQSAPTGARIEDDEEHLVPGADFAQRLPVEAKPWNTSNAAVGEQAGVANDPPDAQPPNYPSEAVELSEDETDPN